MDNGPKCVECGHIKNDHTPMGCLHMEPPPAPARECGCRVRRSERDKFK